MCQGDDRHRTNYEREIGSKANGGHPRRGNYLLFDLIRLLIGIDGTCGDLRHKTYALIEGAYEKSERKETKPSEIEERDPQCMHARTNTPKWLSEQFCGALGRRNGCVRSHFCIQASPDTNAHMWRSKDGHDLLR